MWYIKAEIFGLIIGFIIYAGFMIWFLLNLIRHFQKKEQLHEQQLLSAKYKSEKDLYKAQLEIQEETLLHVSREIHDNVGQSLSLAKLGVTTLDLDKKEDAQPALIEISDIIEKSISDLRDVSRAMNADLVRNQGLKQAIETQVGVLKKSGKYNIVFEFEGPVIEKNPQKELILYRILQESINNIIRHSKASEINILLSTFKSQLKLLIEDDGDGFDVDLAMAGSARPGGIINMKNRADLINADFSIESKLGQGTKILVITTN